MAATTTVCEISLILAEFAGMAPGVSLLAGRVAGYQRHNDAMKLTTVFGRSLRSRLSDRSRLIAGVRPTTPLLVRAPR